ncbi:MAG: tRNA lysidine(34) synthetase TilS [Legionella sp.]|nr:tRNA lysidine(34) synthetase TilS [Legionella sp.]
MINLQLDEGILSFLSASRYLWIGYSGGLDSTALLYKMAKDNRFRTKLRIIHVNHGLSPNAAKWEHHCREICKSLKLPLCIERTKLADTSNLEEKARKARYALYKKHLKPNDTLVLAHHLNDQAETFLLNLCRGAGIDGLAAMKPFKPFQKGFLWRPFLVYSRQEIEAYAQTEGLNWVEDESNLETHFGRNYLRHTVIPLLEQKWPAAIKHLAKASAHCQQSQVHIDQLAQLDCPELIAPKETLNITPLLNLPKSRVLNALRYWLRANNLQIPRANFLEQIFCEVIHAKSSAKPQLTWGCSMLKRFQKTLYLLKDQAEMSTEIFCEEVLWTSFPESLTITGSRLEALSSNEGIEVVPGSKVSVRFRQGGEVFYWRSQKKSLKKLFQEWQVPVWSRQTTPLIYINDVLAMIVGYAISDHFYHRGRDHLFTLGLALQESHEKH